MNKTVVESCVDVVAVLCEHPQDIMNDIPFATDIIYKKHKDEIEKQVKFDIAEAIRQGCVAYRQVMLRV